MAAIVTSEVTQIADVKVRQIAQRIVREFELVAEKVACNFADAKRWPLPADRNSDEALFSARFQALPISLRQSASSRVVARMNDPAASRLAVFGDLANIDLTLDRPIASLVRALPLPRELKLPSSFLSGLSDIPNPFIPADPKIAGVQRRTAVASPPSTASYRS